MVSGWVTTWCLLLKTKCKVLQNGNVWAEEFVGRLRLDGRDADSSIWAPLWCRANDNGLLVKYLFMFFTLGAQGKHSKKSTSPLPLRAVTFPWGIRSK